VKNGERKRLILKGIIKRTIILIESKSSNIHLKRRRVQTARGDGQGVESDGCYEEQRCLALLRSAYTTGAMLESRPLVLGCDGQGDLAVKGKCRPSDDRGWQAEEGGAVDTTARAGAKLGGRGV
jgi:hypothetical protein